MNKTEIMNLLSTIIPLDATVMKDIEKRWDSLTKPLQSLGKLETLITRLGGIQKTSEPAIDKRTVLCFAADHGVVAEAVSPSKQIVTAEMVMNFLNGGAAISVLSDCCNCELKVFNAGMVHKVEDPRVIQVSVGKGTANMRRTRAMTEEQVLKALSIGFSAASNEIDAGKNLLICGEMGVGNTTSATAIYASLTGIDPHKITGTGAGLPRDKVNHKAQVIIESLLLHCPDSEDPLDILSSVGGFELAAMCGVMLAGSVYGCAVLVDGFISGASALLAMKFNPMVKDFLFFSHQSGEEGFAEICRTYQIDPLVDLNMRLGEGTGAVMILPLIDNALNCYYKMATFAEAGVTEIEL